MAVRIHLNHRRLQRWRRGAAPPRSAREVALPSGLTLRLSHTPEGDQLRTHGLASIELPELELVRVQPELRQVARRLLPLAGRQIVWHLLEAGGKPLVLPQLWFGAEGATPPVAVALSQREQGTVRLHPARGFDAPPTRLLTAIRRVLPPHEHAHRSEAPTLESEELLRLRRRFLRGLAPDTRLFVRVGAPQSTRACWIEVLRWTDHQIAGRLASGQRSAWGATWGERVVASPGAVSGWRVDHLDGRTESGPPRP